MSERRDDFFPIPAWPGYSISRLGQVRGKTGVLACDAKGRVRLRNGKRQSSVHVGDLMAQAGLLANPDGAPAAPPECRRRLKTNCWPCAPNATLWKLR